MKTSNTPLMLSSEAPIASNGSEYNYLYLLGLVLAVVLFFMGSFPGACIGALFGLLVGYIVKNCIFEFKNQHLRKKVKFVLYSKVPSTVLVGELTKRLSPMGITVEMNGAGKPVVTHNNIIFDVNFSDDNTFSLWWRLSVGKALLSKSEIKHYRKCVVSMGIIGYHVQQISKEYAIQQSNNT